MAHINSTQSRYSEIGPKHFENFGSFERNLGFCASVYSEAFTNKSNIDPLVFLIFRCTYNDNLLLYGSNRLLNYFFEIITYGCLCTFAIHLFHKVKVAHVTIGLLNYNLVLIHNIPLKIRHVTLCFSY